MRSTFFLSALLCLIVGTMTTTKRGFFIRTVTDGQKTDLKHAWAEAGTLPTEWDQTKQDPAVVEAQIFSSTQRNRQHQKRKILGQYPE